MNSDEVKQSYQNQLLKAGVDTKKAKKAAENLSFEELLLICEIWQDWSIYSPEIQQIIHPKE